MVKVKRISAYLKHRNQIDDLHKKYMFSTILGLLIGIIVGLVIRNYLGR